MDEEHEPGSAHLIYEPIQVPSGPMDFVKLAGLLALIGAAGRAVYYQVLS